MAKRKEVKKIVIEEKIEKNNLPPLCFGCKEDYCVEEYCGEWFDKCVNESVEDDVDNNIEDKEDV